MLPVPSLFERAARREGGGSCYHDRVEHEGTGAESPEATRFLVLHHPGGRLVSPRQLLALAMGLLAAAVGSAAAPTHPVYNPPVGKYILGAMALTAAMFAREAARWP